MFSEFIPDSNIINDEIILGGIDHSFWGVVSAEVGVQYSIAASRERAAQLNLEGMTSEIVDHYSHVGGIQLSVWLPPRRRMGPGLAGSMCSHDL
jgi:hypothetical protein